MCKQCEASSVYEFTNRRKLCKKCFIEYFEKKFFYAIRKFRMIRDREIIGYRNKGDFRSAVLEKMLGKLSKKLNITFVKLSANKRKTGKTAVSSAIDFEAGRIVSNLINGKLRKEFSPVNGKIIKPLYLFLDEEVLLYAKLTGLKFKKQKEKNKRDKIPDFLDELEKKHPEIKRSIVNGLLTLHQNSK